MADQSSFSKYLKNLALFTVSVRMLSTEQYDRLKRKWRREMGHKEYLDMIRFADETRALDANEHKKK